MLRLGAEAIKAIFKIKVCAKSPFSYSLILPYFFLSTSSFCKELSKICIRKIAAFRCLAAKNLENASIRKISTFCKKLQEDL